MNYTVPVTVTGGRLPTSTVIKVLTTSATDGNVFFCRDVFSPFIFSVHLGVTYPVACILPLLAYNVCQHVLNCCQC